MATFDPKSISLEAYPLRAKYRYPSFDGMTAALEKALGLPAGVHLSARAKGASWGSWACDPTFKFPSEELDVALRVLEIVAHKKLTEALAVSYVALAGGEIVAWSEDHSFKPPRPAYLAFVDAKGEPVAVTDAIRAAVQAHATPPAPKGKAKAPAKAETPAKADAPAKPAKAAKAAKTERAFVAETPINTVTVSPDGAVLATSHVDTMVVLWGAEDGAMLRRVKAGGGGMITVCRPAFSPDGKRLATGASSLKIFDVATGAEQEAPPGPAKSKVESITWTPEGVFVFFMAPKDMVLVRYDASAEKKLAEWSWKRAPGVVSGACVDGPIVHLPMGGEPKVARLEVATGKLVTAELPEAVTELFATEAGLWAELEGGRWILLDPTTYAIRRELQLGRRSVRARTSPDGTTIFAAFADGTSERFERVDAKDGSTQARWAHAEVPGLEAYLSALAEAGKDKDTRRYLDYSPEPRLTDVAITPSGDVVATTSWALAVWSPDGTVKTKRPEGRGASA